jgi:hypothetical protein
MNRRQLLAGAAAVAVAPVVPAGAAVEAPMTAAELLAGQARVWRNVDAALDLAVYGTSYDWAMIEGNDPPRVRGRWVPVKAVDLPWRDPVRT